MQDRYIIDQLVECFTGICFYAQWRLITKTNNPTPTLNPTPKLNPNPKPWP